MEPGETMETALRREIKEELGKELHITDVKPRAVLAPLFPDRGCILS